MHLYQISSAVLFELSKARTELLSKGVSPRIIFVSPEAHEIFAEELARRDGSRKPVRIFTMMGLPVLIDYNCPKGGAYMEGDIGDDN